MEDDELLRYSRHILLNEIGIEGQQRLSLSRILLIGAGGLGSACLPYLASSGIGKITIADDDTVDLTNLQRQIIHNSNSIGSLKVDSAKQMLTLLNPLSEINTIPKRVDIDLLNQLVPQADVVIDCTDNFQTRHMINKACFHNKVPLVSGAAIQTDAQLSVFDFRQESSTCYACIFPPDQHFEEVKCSTMGVFAPLVGIIGAMQAAQALQLLVPFGESLMNKLLMWDAMNTQITQIKITKNNSCPICGMY
jgi:molybdopterin/thiamine biosynthesis adenylyltransferase